MGVSKCCGLFVHCLRRFLYRMQLTWRYPPHTDKRAAHVGVLGMGVVSAAQ